jgi:putative hydrolase of HD superfamily
VNKDELMKICLVHDLAESVVGDITPNCGVSKEDKKKIEEVSAKPYYKQLN